MSYHTWTAEELESNITPLRGVCWRFVEAQHICSTMKIVDTAEEQSRLEVLLDSTKPPVPEECRNLNYLLFTPFRYNPAPQGSRFRRHGQVEGAFYAAEKIETALAEISFYKMLFFAESPDTPLPANPCDYTGFSVQYKSERSIDLSELPLSAQKDQWENPDDYTNCQALADEARRGRIEIIRSNSVRCPLGGKNLTLLSCAGFAEKNPSEYQGWRLTIKADRVIAVKETPIRTVSFTLDDFKRDKRILR